jgi:hypothetical protein
MVALKETITQQASQIVQLTAELSALKSPSTVVLQPSNNVDETSNESSGYISGCEDNLSNVFQLQAMQSSLQSDLYPQPITDESNSALEKSVEDTHPFEGMIASLEAEIHDLTFASDDNNTINISNVANDDIEQLNVALDAANTTISNLQTEVHSLHHQLAVIGCVSYNAGASNNNSNASTPAKVDDSNDHDLEPEIQQNKLDEIERLESLLNAQILKNEEQELALVQLNSEINELKLGFPKIYIDVFMVIIEWIVVANYKPMNIFENVQLKVIKSF